MLVKIFKGTLDTVDTIAWYAGSVVRSFKLGMYNQLPEYRTETMKQIINEVREEREGKRKVKSHRTIGFL